MEEEDADWSDAGDDDDDDDDDSHYYHHYQHYYRYCHNHYGDDADADADADDDDDEVEAEEENEKDTWESSSIATAPSVHQLDSPKTLKNAGDFRVVFFARHFWISLKK